MIANELNYIIKPQQEHHRQAQTVDMYRTTGQSKNAKVKLFFLKYVLHRKPSIGKV